MMSPPMQPLQQPLQPVKPVQPVPQEVMGNTSDLFVCTPLFFFLHVISWKRFIFLTDTGQLVAQPGPAVQWSPTGPSSPRR